MRAKGSLRVRLSRPRLAGDGAQVPRERVLVGPRRVAETLRRAPGAHLVMDRYEAGVAHGGFRGLLDHRLAPPVVHRHQRLGELLVERRGWIVSANGDGHPAGPIPSGEE